MSKTVSFARPVKPAKPDPESWVSGAGVETTPSATPQASKVAKEVVPMKRLTLDIPEELHRRVKSGCANRGEKIAEVVRRYLDSEFPAA